MDEQETKRQRIQQETDEDEVVDISTKAEVEVIEISTDSEESEVKSSEPLPKKSTRAQYKRARWNQVLSFRRGLEIHDLLPSDIQAHKQNVTWNGDPELLGTYNWSDAEDSDNTIFAPGAPPKWTPQTIPYCVPADRGFHPTCYNSARQPMNPYTPVFHAMSLMNPDYSFLDVDILADRNSLRKLLEFVQDKSVGPFRLDLYIVVDTLVIVRREIGVWQRSTGDSHGFNFEKHFTTPSPDLTDAAAYYRAIRYRMGPLDVVCRYEADAYVDTPADTLSESEAVAVVPPLMKDDLMQRPRFDFTAPFHVLQKGHMVPNNQILELKTQIDKPGDNSPKYNEWNAQLWFGRTKHLYIGRYEKGTGKVLRTRQEDATERVKRWEDVHQTDLRKLVGLLGMLREIVGQEPGPVRAAVLVREHPRGPATLHEMLDKKTPIPRPFLEKNWLQHTRGGPRQQVGGQEAGKR